MCQVYYKWLQDKQGCIHTWSEFGCFCNYIFQCTVSTSNFSIFIPYILLMYAWIGCFILWLSTRMWMYVLYAIFILSLYSSICMRTWHSLGVGGRFIFLLFRSLFGFVLVLGFSLYFSFHFRVSKKKKCEIFENFLKMSS